MNLIGAILAWNFLRRLLGMLGEGVAHAAPHAVTPAGHAAAAVATTHAPMPTGTVRTATSTAVPMGEQPPAGLPAWPTGWASGPATPETVARAQVLLATMANNTTKYEKAPSGWLAYHKGPMGGGVVGVSVWHPRATSSTSSAVVPAHAAAPSASGMPMIRRGSTGPAVATWQGLIGIPADGKFGPITDHATRAWQTAHGLKADGIVGPLTWATVGH